MKVFFDTIRPLYPRGFSLAQVDRIEALYEGLKERKVPIRYAAYIFATAHHESGGFIHLHEIWGPTEQQKKYEFNKRLGNVVKGDGKKFMGRGLVQLTGRRNYSDWSRRLGVDLLTQPELAASMRYAVPILIEGMMEGTFTGRALPDYINYVDMRKVVNGTDRAAKIARYALLFEEALNDAGYVAVDAKPEPPAVTPSPTKPSEPVSKPEPRRSLLSVIIEALFRLLKGK